MTVKRPNRFVMAMQLLLAKDSVQALSLTEPKYWSDERFIEDGRQLAADKALSLSAVWACVNLIAGTIATLPLIVYRELPDGSRVVEKDHPLYRVLHDSPNALQTAVDFWEFEQASVELWGSAYARKLRARGQVVGLLPVMPDLPVVSYTGKGNLRYRWSERGESFDLSSDDVFHIRGFGGNPLGGMSTLAFGARSFGLSLEIERSAAATFRNGLKPSVVLAFKEWLGKERRDDVSAAVQAKYLGALNAGRPFIAEGGVEVKTLSINPNDAQMLESRSLSIEDACRFFGVPPFMIGHTEKSTSWGSGLEQQTLGFLRYTLRTRIKRIEQAIMKQLVSPQDRAAGLMVEFSLEGLLRADSAARAGFYQSGLTNGWMTINEVRALENLPPVPGGDVPRMQQQNVPITSAPAPDEATDDEPGDET